MAPVANNNQGKRVIPPLELAFRELAMRSKMYVKALQIIDDARKSLIERAEPSKLAGKEQEGES